MMLLEKLEYISREIPIWIVSKSAKILSRDMTMVFKSDRQDLTGSICSIKDSAESIVALSALDLQVMTQERNWSDLFEGTVMWIHC